MAILQTGFLPYNHLVFTDNFFPNFTPQKTKLFSKNLNNEASTARNLQLKRRALLTKKNPHSHLDLVADIKRRNCDYEFGKSEESDPFSSIFESNSRLWCYNCKQVHGYFVKLGGVGWNSLIGSKIAVFYLRSGGLLGDARKMFDEMTERSVEVYAALIGSYCRCEKWVEVFSVFGLMVFDGVLPDRFLVPRILKACSAVKLERIGRMIHGYVVRREFGSDVFVSNALIDVYANCGNLGYARSVFDVMRERDVVSWTALVSAYMDEGLICEAEDTFQSMEISGVKPDLISWNALVSGYARNGEVHRSVCCLEEMQVNGVMPKVTSWNAVISGCVYNGCYEDALVVFCKMLRFPERPNAVTIVSSLSSCARLEDLKIGKAIHGYTLKRELHRNEHVVGSLVDMYSKCARNDCVEKVFLTAGTKNIVMWNEMIASSVNVGKMDSALQLFKTMQNDGIRPDEFTYNTLLAGLARNGYKNEAYALLADMVSTNLQLDVVTFNVLINGFQQAGLSREALKLFRNMQLPTKGWLFDRRPHLSVRPNVVSTTGSLAACADLLQLQQGKEIHGYVIKNGFEDNIFVQCALVDVYAKCHDIGSATKVFWNIKDRNTITWNTMISGFIKNSQPEKALEYFCEMLRESIEPTSITFMTLVPACGEMEALNVGKQCHCYILKSLFSEHKNALVGALRNMYEKCNCTEDARLICDPI
ncbi:Pentatricopeptide repeat-containing protein [Heracleum sosnowskyi]|uniref:Pentatricopeptide repeat-containing protein n=1 Tax=Heracleum sosnowskyi TaxID=360622 RepID=A0AAD8HS50_9APIA|nr:Pentatricopeptide repeat-containing protein [Heracleum sosnowskyi]